MRVSDEFDNASFEAGVSDDVERESLIAAIDGCLSFARNEQNEERV